MDIQKWLDETVLPGKAPTPPDQFHLAPCLQPKNRQKEPNGTRRLRRARSDSPFLEPRPACPQKALEGGSIIHGGSDESVCSEAHRSTGNSPLSRVSSQPYGRKPRRKTRPDRYEPKANCGKEREMHVYRDQAGESRKRKRKPKRKRSDTSGMGLVQSFRAKNVSQDRLTLKPRKNLGLFNKGKAASPVKGRGLPDLVFSEMKFLQKHKDQPDLSPDTGLPERPRTKRHALARGEEISAYFTSVRPALQEKNANTQAKEGSCRENTRGALEQHECERSSLTNNAIPTVELPASEAVSVRFGSRGPRHGSSSYISWSESLRPPSRIPIRSQAGSTIEVGQPDTTRPKKDKARIGGENTLHSPAPPNNTKRPTHANDGRPNIPSFDVKNHPAFQSQFPPDKADQSHTAIFTGDQQSHRQTLEAGVPLSLVPEVVSSHENRSAGRPHDDCAKAIASLDDVPDLPDGSKVRQQTQQTERVTSPESRRTENTKHDSGNTSNLERLLQECNVAFNQRRYGTTIALSPNNTQLQLDCRPVDNKPFSDLRHLAPVQAIPPIRISGSGIPRRAVADIPRPGIYEEQELRQRGLREWEITGDYLGPEYDALEMEALDQVGSGMDMDGQEYEELLGDGMFAAEETQLFDDALAMDGDFQYDRYRRAGGVQDVEVSAGGFWRPNKLY